jgi:hypothetical protein
MVQDEVLCKDKLFGKRPDIHFPIVQNYNNQLKNINHLLQIYENGTCKSNIYGLLWHLVKSRLFSGIVIFIFLLQYAPTCFSQATELHPVSVVPLHHSLEGEEEYRRNQKLSREVKLKLDEGASMCELTSEEESALKISSEGDYYQILKAPCSWNCGSGPYKISASSHLTSIDSIVFLPGYAHDLNFKHAWAEGEDGYGIGEFLIYTFSSTTKKMDRIYVANGFVRTEIEWKEYSSVKKLKMYVNDEPYAILNLENIRGVQQFHIDPLGNAAIRDIGSLNHLPDLNIKFEIMEVYKGLKYDDVVITEIYFHDHDFH